MLSKVNAVTLRRYIVYVLCLMILGTIVGLKPFRWADYEVYYSIYFLKSASESYSNLITQIDPLFWFLNKLFASWDFVCFTLVIAFVTMALKLSVFIHFRNTGMLVLLLYLSYLLWLHDYVQIRIAFALGVFFWAQTFVRSSLWFLFFSILAISIHSSMAVIVLFYLAHKVFGTKWVLIITNVFLVIFWGFIFSGVTGFSKIDNYIFLLKAGEFSKINPWASLPLIQLVFCLFVLLSKSLRELYLKSFIFAASVQGVLFFYFLLEIPVFSFRLSELFMLYFLLLISDAWKHSDFAKILYGFFFFAGLKSSFWGAASLFNLI